MAGLFLTRDGDAALDSARRRYAALGFGEPEAIALPGWRGLAWRYVHGGPETVLRVGADLVAVAGTLSYDGLFGTEALERLLAKLDPLAPDWSRLGGQFAALVVRGGRAFVLTDYLAAFQIFHDSDRRFLSTSLLAAADAMPALLFDAQGVYEYAFNAVPTGDDTVIAGLKTLGPRVVIELTADGSVLHPLAKPLPDTPADLPFDQRVATHRDLLMAVVEAHVARFGSGVRCPLSAGLDSRLALAALRAGGCTPHVYVYGAPDEDDVRIAQAIGASQGFAVECLDKDAAPIAADAFADQVALNFDRYDGLPNFGTIFDNGANLAAMDARHAGGALAVSGGGGEIYRNFFYLPDRPMTADDVAASFFARFAPGDATDLFDGGAFLGAIADKIAGALDRPRGALLPRLAVEQVYPRLRTRSLFGREISTEARHGAYLLPFLDHRVVAEAMTLPMHLKAAGRFEAALINAIDPALAAEPSGYGHDFAGPPSLSHRFGEWRSTQRPVWLRRHSYAIQRRLRPMGDEHGGLLIPDYLDRVIEPGFPVMRRYFNVDRITDSAVLRHIAALEYFGQRLNIA